MTKGATWIPVLLTAVAFVAGCAPSREDDAALVYCLASTQRARVVEAAVTLGSGIANPGATVLRTRDGKELSLEGWRGESPESGAAFDRACAAIAPTGPPNGVLELVRSLGNLVAGGLIALGSTMLLNRWTRRRQAAAAVREAAVRLSRAVDAVVRARERRLQGGAADEVALERLDVLESALRTAASATRRDLTTKALSRLDALAPLLVQPPASGSPRDVRAQSDDLKAAARDATAGAETVADALERLRW